MDKAKKAIDDFTTRAGHHDTTVSQNVIPSVQHETVKPTQHEEINRAINKELHQDHYHHTIRPVHDTHVLLEQHLHKSSKVINCELDNRDASATERALRAEASKLHDERTVTNTTHT